MKIETQDQHLRLSIVVVFYNMAREAERTLWSLSAHYQIGIEEQDYEVIVIDNGSTNPIQDTDMSRFGDNFQYHFIEDAQPSPVDALNQGVRRSHGACVAVMIDGAHLLTPGVLQYALKAMHGYDNAVVGLKCCFLGPGQQRDTIHEGYNKMVEDGLLNYIEWPSDGYRLFEIGTFYANAPGWFYPMIESNCLFLRRSLFDELGGFDERFDIPGGGFANIDLFKRAVETDGVDLVYMLGEASFHQLHGGTTTNVSPEEKQNRVNTYKEQYKQIHGKEWKHIPFERDYIGHLPNPVENISGRIMRANANKKL